MLVHRGRPVKKIKFPKQGNFAFYEIAYINYVRDAKEICPPPLPPLSWQIHHLSAFHYTSLLWIGYATVEILVAA